MNVGVNSIRTRSALDLDALTTPRSTTRDDRDLGSGISASASQTAASVSGHHWAPTGAERRTIVISSQSSANSAPGVAALDRLDLVPAHPLRQRRPQLRREHAERVRPQLLDRAGIALLAAQPLEPHLGVQAVVDLLALDLRGDSGELGVLVLLEARDPDRVRGLVEDVPRDRPRPVGHEPQLDERRAAVLLGLAVEGERVGIRPELRGGELVERPRVPDLVLRDRREGDVLLEERRDPRPLRVAPAEDQLVVGELKEQLCPLAHVPPSASP